MSRILFLLVVSLFITNFVQSQLANERKDTAAQGDDQISLRKSKGDDRKRSRKRRSSKNRGNSRQGQQDALTQGSIVKSVEDIMFETERYHMWWAGAPNDPSAFTFSPESWSASHNPTNNAIFTMAITQGLNDRRICSSPNDLLLFLGSARRVYSGDIVIALNTDELTQRMKQVLTYFKAIVYLIPSELCTRAAKAVFCGSEEERVPATAFRFFFYERWATAYNESSSILFSDFRDVFFQADPFLLSNQQAVPKQTFHGQLALFREFIPNLVIGRCRLNKQLTDECYGTAALQAYGHRAVVTSGAIIGHRNAMILLSHFMTRQLQEAPGRAAETRCGSGGIDHAFLHHLLYTGQLHEAMLPSASNKGGRAIEVYDMGEGPIISLGGLRSDTASNLVYSNGTDPFYGLLTPSSSNDSTTIRGYEIRGWNGVKAAVVHQADHFATELLSTADHLLQDDGSALKAKYTGPMKGSDSEREKDRMWQSLTATQCLFDCQDSPAFG